MPKHAMTDAVVTIAGLDVTDHCREVTIETSFASLETTPLGATFREYSQALGDVKVTMTLFQDYAAASIHATLWPLALAGSVVPVTVKPTSAAVSATNPLMSINSAIYDYVPLGGAAGDAQVTPATFMPADASGLSIATS